MKIMTNATRATTAVLAATLLTTGCDLDLQDPNNPTEDAVVGDVSGLLQVAVGLQAEYGNEIVDPIYVTGLVADEIGAGAATFDSYQRVDRGDPIDNDLDPSEGPWSGQYDVIQIADVLLDNAPDVGMGQATLSGVLALANTYKAMALGNLLMIYQRVPVDVGPSNPNPSFVSREEGIEEVLGLLDQARQQVQSTPPSGEFNNNVLAPGLDLVELIDAMIARYSLAFERYDQALQAAQRVDLSTMSEFRYTSTDVNPLWNLWYNSNNAYQMRPEDQFRLEAEAGDQRVDYWVDEADIEGAVVPLDHHDKYQDREADIPAYFPDEMRLIMAEVHARNNNLGEALELVNEVRTQCQSALDEPVACLDPLLAAEVPTQQAMLDEILKQRRYELFLTGLRWNDLKRFGEPVKYQFLNVARSECERNPNAPDDLCGLTTTG